MDTDLIKALLSTQEQAYRGAVEMLFKQANDNIKAVQSTVIELTTSLEFTQREVEDLKKELKQCKEEKIKDNLTIKKLQEDLQGSKVMVKELEDRANYMEDYSRRNNLQVIGIEEDKETETWEQTAVKVSKLIEEKLQLPNIELERAHRVGQRDSQRHRPIVARFKRFGDREAVMRNARKLRGTRIYINEDLCPASQSIKRDQLPFLKQARSEGKVAYFRGTKLVVKDRGLASRASERAAVLGSSSGSDAGTGVSNVGESRDAPDHSRAASPGGDGAVRAPMFDATVVRTSVPDGDAGGDVGRDVSLAPAIGTAGKTEMQRKTRATARKGRE